MILLENLIKESVQELKSKIQGQRIILTTNLNLPDSYQLIFEKGSDHISWSLGHYSSTDKKGWMSFSDGEIRTSENQQDVNEIVNALKKLSDELHSIEGIMRSFHSQAEGTRAVVTRGYPDNEQLTLTRIDGHVAWHHESFTPLDTTTGEIRFRREIISEGKVFPSGEGEHPTIPLS